MSNARIRTKKAVKSALAAKVFVFSDTHMPETKLQKKVRLAVARQVEQLKREVVVTGDEVPLE